MKTQPRVARLATTEQINDTITVKDGTATYYKDWGAGPVVTFPTDGR